MDQNVGTDRTLGNLEEFGKTFISAIVLGFVLEGLFLSCTLIYSMVFYRFIAGIEGLEYVGMVIIYIIFIMFLIVMLYLFRKGLHFSKRAILRGFMGTLALYSIILPFTPISWYNDRYTFPDPSIGLIYGSEYQLWPLLTIVGIAALAVLLLDFRNGDEFRQYKTMLLFSGVVSTLATLVSMLVLSIPPDTGQIDNLATPFFMLPHITGLALVVESVSQYLGTRNRYG